MPDIKSQIITGHLQNVSIGFKNKAYTSPEIVPQIVLPTSSAKVSLFNRGDSFRDTAELRARGTKVASTNYKISTSTISTEQYASRNEITDEDLRDAGLPNMLSVPIDMRAEAIALNSDKLDLKNEILISTAVKAGTWLDGNVGGEDANALWAIADTTNTMIEDVDAAIEALQGAGIPRENIRLALDSTTFQKAIRCADLVAALGYTAVTPKAPGLVITAEMLASLLTIDKVVVCSSLKNSANEKADGTDFTGANIWGGTKGFGFVYYYPTTISRKIMAPAFNAFNKMPNGAMRTTKTWYDNDISATVYQSEQEVGYKQVCSYAGYLFKDTHTT